MASTMTPPMTPPQFPLPAVCTALSPYIHPPQEALHIRQLATLHLASLSAEKRTTQASGSTDEFHRFLDFELGRRGGPAQGARRQYLLALRANWEARRAYESVLRDDPDVDEDSTGEGDGEGWRELYLDTLKLRRQRERLELLRVYLTTVSDPPAGPAEGFNEQPPAPPVQLTSMQSVATSGEEMKAGVGAMMLRLEKEVVAAHEALEREKTRIQELQEGLGDDPNGTKKEALIRARETLIAWLEGQLARTTGAAAAGEDEDMMDVTPADEGEEEDGSSAQQIVARIQAAYTDYLHSRTELVHILASVSSSSSSETPPLTLDPTDAPAELPGTMKKPLPAPPVLSALTGIEHLLPLTKYTKSLLHQRTQLSTALSARQLGLLRMLESALERHGIQPPSIAASTASPAREMAGALAARAKEGVAGCCVEVGRNVGGARETLGRVERVLVEMEALVEAPRRERETSRIPLRKGKGGRVEEAAAAEKKGWGLLGGGVGVIGDGI